MGSVSRSKSIAPRARHFQEKLPGTTPVGVGYESPSSRTSSTRKVYGRSDGAQHHRRQAVPAAGQVVRRFGALEARCAVDPGGHRQTGRSIALRLAVLHDAARTCTHRRRSGAGRTPGRRRTAVSVVQGGGSAAPAGGVTFHRKRSRSGGSSSSDIAPVRRTSLYSGTEVSPSSRRTGLEHHDLGDGSLVHHLELAGGEVAGPLLVRGDDAHAEGALRLAPSSCGCRPSPPAALPAPRSDWRGRSPPGGTIAAGRTRDPGRR